MTLLAFLFFLSLGLLAAQPDNKELVLAIHSKDIKRVKKALRNSTIVNAPGAGAYTPLMNAAQAGDVEIIKLLLAKGADITYQTPIPNIESPLTVAIKYKNAPALKVLLEQSMKVNPKRTEDDLPMLLSMAANDPESVKVLQESGIGTGDQELALQRAANSGNLEAAGMLLSKGAKTEPSDDSYPALCQAASNGHDKVVALLLDHGAKIDACNITKLTPLMFAAEKGHVTTVEILIARGADVHLKSSTGETALDKARQKGHERIVEKLEAAAGGSNK